MPVSDDKLCFNKNIRLENHDSQFCNNEFLAKMFLLKWQNILKAYLFS